jgi:hypothetical protein
VDWFLVCEQLPVQASFKEKRLFVNMLRLYRCFLLCEQNRPRIAMHITAT